MNLWEKKVALEEANEKHQERPVRVGKESDNCIETLMVVCGDVTERER